MPKLEREMGTTQTWFSVICCFVHVLLRTILNVTSSMSPSLWKTLRCYIIMFTVWSALSVTWNSKEKDWDGFASQGHYNLEWKVILLVINTCLLETSNISSKFRVNSLYLWGKLFPTKFIRTIYSWNSMLTLKKNSKRMFHPNIIIGFLLHVVRFADEWCVHFWQRLLWNFQLIAGAWCLLSLFTPPFWVLQKTIYIILLFVLKTSWAFPWKCIKCIVFSYPCRLFN